ncbi:MAG: histidine ammonia-lyase [Sphingobacteriaceae bacterium]
MKTFAIGSAPLSVALIQRLIQQHTTLSLSKEAEQAVQLCRHFLDQKMAANENPVYGINTGFGYLQHVKVASNQLSGLQHNLLLSHACGTGDLVPQEVVKLMLLLKIQSLAYGNSGVSVETIHRLIEFYNQDILPVVYTQGSLGASGDLAPLAHLALPLIGMGEVWLNGQRISAEKALKEFGLKPLELQTKEGLALINGTQFMAAYGLYILLKGEKLALWADVIGSLSADAFNCRIDPFKPASHAIRPHRGQVETAATLFEILNDSELIKQPNKQVQDPYSFRCMPQVHGASKDTLNYVKSVFETEINSVTDNPNIFPEQDEIISAGNFHGQPLALALDFLSIALAEWGSIAERRIFQLISGQRGLPPFLVADAGLNSGFMIPQYTAASIASENKQLCTPSSVDSIVSSNGQEDHVSMGANGAVKCLKVALNLERILAIELMNAAQALEFRRPQKSSPMLEKIYTAYRDEVPAYEQDRFLAPDIEASIQFLRNYSFAE